MAKLKRFHVGDKVTWKGGPGELSHNLTGRIIVIKQGYAYVDHPYSGVGEFAKLFGGNFNKMLKSDHIRQIPITKLRLSKC